MATAKAGVSVTFVVHNVKDEVVRDEVEHKGKKIAAMVDAVEIELVTEGAHGSFTARFTGEEATKIRGLYKSGDKVSLTF